MIHQHSFHVLYFENPQNSWHNTIYQSCLSYVIKLRWKAILEHVLKIVYTMCSNKFHTKLTNPNTVVKAIFWAKHYKIRNWFSYYGWCWHYNVIRNFYKFWSNTFLHHHFLFPWISSLDISNSLGNAFHFLNTQIWSIGCIVLNCTQLYGLFLSCSQVATFVFINAKIKHFFMVFIMLWKIGKKPPNSNKTVVYLIWLSFINILYLWIFISFDMKLNHELCLLTT